MLHVLLLILKILGIVLLAVFGLLLLAVLLVLFVPVRYRLDGSGDKDRKGYGSGDALISWLLHFATFRAVYGEDGLTVRARILFFTLFEDTVFEGFGESGTETEAGGDAGEADGDLFDEILEEAGNAGEAETGSVESAENAESGGPEQAESKTAADDVTEAVSGPATENEPAAEEEPAPEKESTAESESAPEKEAAPEKKPEVENEPKTEAEPAAEKKSVGDGLERAASGAQNVFRKIRCKIRAICGKLEKGEEISEKIRDFLENTENQKTIALLWRQTKKLFCHILPRKVSGNVRFGFDDPYYTGQVLAAVSTLYAFYGESLSLEPVFDRTALDGEIHIRGRIRMAALLWIAVRVFFNKNFRKLLREWRK